MAPAITRENLPDVQAWMMDAISGQAPRPEDVARVLTDGPRSSAAERLEIHRFGYVARLVECLADDYPVLARTLGEDGFQALAARYIEQYPSRSPSLNAFGRHMARFCTGAKDLLGEPRQFYAELAELEWALVEAIHAPPGNALDPDKLQSIPEDAWGRARLVPSPTVRVLHFSFPVNAFFQESRLTGARVPVPDAAPTATAVYRHEQVLWRMDLTPAMARVLVALLGGEVIADALGLLAVNESSQEAIAEAERNVQVWFRQWASSGFFSDVVVGS